MLRWIKRWVIRMIFFALLFMIALQAWYFSHVWYWVYNNPTSTSFMDKQLDRLRKENSDAKLLHQWIPYKQISPYLKQAVIAAEDDKFIDHEGFDWEGIEAAYEKNLKKGKIVAGGSTISQQLSKNLFLSSSKTPWRKGQEAIITLMLEKMMSKRRILEIYLNVIEWGNGVFGAQAASVYYYRINAAQLTPYQAARLAAMIPKPRYYDKKRNSKGLERQTNRLLSRMNHAQLPN